MRTRLLAALLSLTVPATAGAVTAASDPVRFTDLNPTQALSNHGTQDSFVALTGTSTVFVARFFSESADTRSELFVTDGTGGGTVQISSFADATDLVAAGRVGSTALGFGETWRPGVFIWNTDGTAAGTSRFAFGDTYDAGALQGAPVAALGKMWFFGRPSSDDAYDLYSTDGTPAGTVKHGLTAALQIDSTSQIVGGAGTRLVVVNDDLLFLTDGTAPGTSSRTMSAASRYALVNGKVIYASGTSGEVRVTNGVSDTTLVTAPSAAFSFASSGTLAVFMTSGSPSKIWASDGSSAGTGIVSDAAANFGLAYMGDVASGSIFSAGSNLLKTNGSAGGTSLFAVTFNSVEASVTAGGAVYFIASAGATGTEVYRTDGTAVGTAVVIDKTPGTGSGAQGGLGVVGSQALASLRTATVGSDLYAISGTSVSGVKSFARATKSSYPMSGVPFMEGALFTSDQVRVAYAPMGGTAVDVGAAVLGASERVQDIFVLGTSGFFISDLSGSHVKLFRTNGAADGSTVVETLSGHEFYCAVPFKNGRLLVTDSSAMSRRELRFFNGTTLSGALTAADSGCPTVFNGKAYFPGGTDAAGTEPWVTDGTVAGTRQVQDLNPGATSSSALVHAKATAHALVSTAIENIGGTPTGTVVALRAGSGGFQRVSSAGGLVIAADERYVYFVSDSDSDFQRVDTTTLAVQAVTSGIALKAGLRLTVNDDDGYDLTTATGASTTLAPRAGVEHDLIGSLTLATGNVLLAVYEYFETSEVAEHTLVLYVSDGTIAGTREAYRVQLDEAQMSSLYDAQAILAEYAGGALLSYPGDYGDLEPYFFSLEGFNEPDADDADDEKESGGALGSWLLAPLGLAALRRRRATPAR